MVSAQLNLALCFITSGLAGLGAGFFGVILSVADKLKRQRGAATRKSRMMMAVGAVGSTCMGLASIAGLYFGPITLVTIIRAGSTLPANAFFSQFFGLRRLVKDDYLGTLACICGVVCFVCYQGPPSHPPTTEEFLDRFTSPWAISWNSVLFVTLLAAIGLVVFYELKGTISYKGIVSAGNAGKAAAVAVVIGCASSFMDVAIKGWSSTFHGEIREDALATPIFWVAFLSNVIFLVIMRLGMIFGCARCDVLLFVPLSQVLNVFLSVATGMIVLDEGRDIYSWTGLVFSMISVVAGLLMLIQGPAESQDAASEPARVVSGILGHGSLASAPAAMVPRLGSSPSVRPAHLASAPGVLTGDGGAMVRVPTAVPTATLPGPATIAAEPAEEPDEEEPSDSEEDSSDPEGLVRAATIPEYSDIYIPRPITLLRLNEWHERAAASRDRSQSELQEYRRRARAESVPMSSMPALTVSFGSTGQLPVSPQASASPHSIVVLPDGRAISRNYSAPGIARGPVSPVAAITPATNGVDARL